MNPAGEPAGSRALIHVLHQSPLANDGVHPNRDGYASITLIARAAIARALGKTAPKGDDNRSWQLGWRSR